MINVTNFLSQDTPLVSITNPFDPAGGSHPISASGLRDTVTQDSSIGGVSDPPSWTDDSDTTSTKPYQGTASEDVAHESRLASQHLVEPILPKFSIGSPPIIEREASTQDRWNSIANRLPNVQEQVRPSLPNLSVKNTQHSWHSSQVQQSSSVSAFENGTVLERRPSVNLSHGKHINHPVLNRPVSARKPLPQSPDLLSHPISNRIVESTADYGAPNSIQYTWNVIEDQNGCFSDRELIKRPGQLDYAQRPSSPIEGNWIDTTLYPVQQGHRNETVRSSRPPVRRRGGAISQDLPLQSVEDINAKGESDESDESYEEFSESILSREVSTQTEHHTGASGRWQPGNVLKGRTRTVRGGLEYRGNKGWGEPLSTPQKK